jgi:hypothetical protein
MEDETGKTKFLMCDKEYQSYRDALQLGNGIRVFFEQTRVFGQLGRIEMLEIRLSA